MVSIWSVIATRAPAMVNSEIAVSPLTVVAERADGHRVAVQDHLARSGDVRESGEAEERVVPLGPDGLPGLRPSLRMYQVPKLASLSIRIRSPYCRSAAPWSKRFGITRLSCMSPAAWRIQDRASR